MKLERMTIQKVIKASGVSKDGREWKRTEVVLHDVHSQVETRCVARLQQRVVEQFPDLKEGDEYDVELGLSCREYDGRFYNELYVWQMRDPT